MKLTILEQYIYIYNDPHVISVSPKKTGGSKSPTHLDRWSFQSVKWPIAFWRGYRSFFFRYSNIEWWTIKSNMNINKHCYFKRYFIHIYNLYIYTLNCILSITYVFTIFYVHDMLFMFFWCRSLILLVARCHPFQEKKGHTPKLRLQDS